MLLHGLAWLMVAAGGECLFFFIKFFGFLISLTFSFSFQCINQPLAPLSHPGVRSPTRIHPQHNAAAVQREDFDVRKVSAKRDVATEGIGADTRHIQEVQNILTPCKL